MPSLQCYLGPLFFTGDVCPSALRFHEAPQSHDVESNFPTAGISCCYTSIQCAETTHLKAWRIGIVTRNTSCASKQLASSICGKVNTDVEM